MVKGWREKEVDNHIQSYPIKRTGRACLSCKSELEIILPDPLDKMGDQQEKANHVDDLETYSKEDGVGGIISKPFSVCDEVE
jgi:hypothetical protein